MDRNGRGISIGTVSGGVVNFGGAVNITPISVTKTITGAGGSNSGSGTGSCNGQSRGSSSTGSNGTSASMQSISARTGSTGGASKARSGGTNSGSILTTNNECCIFNQRNWANIVDLIRRSIE